MPQPARQRRGPEGGPGGNFSALEENTAAERSENK